MIKILFFIETLAGGGAEKVLRDLVNHMDQSQFDITVQTVWPCEERKLLIPGVKYKSTYPLRNSFTEVIYRIEAASSLLYRLHVKDDYDIECAYLEAGSTKVIASSTNKKAKKLAWVHCDLRKKIKGTPQEYVKKTKSWYQTFDKIVCVSKDVEGGFRELYGSDLQTVVIYNVVDDNAIFQKAAKSSTLKKRKLTVVTLGRLTWQKGYDILLRVHRRLIEDGFDYDLWIAGEGEERQQLENDIKENHLQNSVMLLGFCDNPYPLLRQADFLVCSSRFEGFSTFVTEGVILGKPIVTTDCTGMRELLGDSEFGLITSNNEEALYEGMKKMLRSEQLRLSYAEKAIQRAEHFSAKQLTEETELFFQGVTKYEH